jgi:hypothetical protein
MALAALARVNLLSQNFPWLKPRFKGRSVARQNLSTAPRSRVRTSIVLACNTRRDASDLTFVNVLRIEEDNRRLRRESS